MKYIGIDWRQETIISLPIKPKDFLIFCDLRDCVLDELDLSEVEFLGCRLNGTSFQRATLRKTRFIGCFSSHHGSPTDFRNSVWQSVSVIDSHIYCYSNENNLDLQRWTTEIVDAIWDTLASSHDIILNAFERLVFLENPTVAPILANFLVSNGYNTWDIRKAALEALGWLRQFDKTQKFPQRDQILLEWMFLCLGDENAFVRQTAKGLVKTFVPPDNVLLASTRRMMGQTTSEKLAGLNASLELYYLSEKYTRLVNLKTLLSLLNDEDEDVRSRARYFYNSYICPDTRIEPVAVNAQYQARYKETPDRAYTIEGTVYMLQRRPQHPHIIVNNQYKGISVIEPISGKQILQVDFPNNYDPYGIINSWCFRSDGKAVLVFNEQSRTGCLLSLEINGTAYNLECSQLQNFTDVRYTWENDSLWLRGGNSAGYFNLIWQNGFPNLVARGGIQARINQKNWCLALDKIDFKSKIIRIEPDLSQILYYSTSEQPEKIEVSNWRQETIWSARASEFVSVMAVYDELVFMMYEHEVHAINQQGQVETIYAVPLGFYCGGIDTLGAIDNYPASLIIACSSWNEPKQTQILVYQLALGRSTRAGGRVLTLGASE